MKRGGKRATLDDVARMAGVSPITVSRALHKPDLVSAELRRRIEQVARRLAYVPDVSASRLASSRSKTIGVIVPTLYNVIFAEYLQALHEVLIPAGFQPIVVNSRYSDEGEEYAIRTLLGQRVEAIIMVGVSHTKLASRMLAGSRIPVIETFEMSEEPLGINIGFRQDAAGYDAAKFLFGKGYRRIGFMVGHLDVRAQARLAGYRKFLMEQDLDDEQLIFSTERHSTVALGAALIEKLLAGAKLPDAIYCIDDNVALGVMHGLRNREIRIPHEVAVLGFHDLEFAASSSPSLSSVFTHRHHIGTLAAEAALRALNGAGAPRELRIDVGYRITEREST